MLVMRFLFLLFGVFSHASYAMDGDPLAHLRYDKAFDLESVYKKYRPYLAHIGSDENALGKDQGDPRPHVVTLEGEHWKKEQKRFEAACLAQLQSERRRTLRLPLISNFMFMGAVYVPPAIYIPLLGGIGELAAALSLSSTVFLVAPALNNIFTTVQNLVFTPNHPVDPLEVSYATRQHLIPQALWGVAKGYFTQARQSFTEDTYKKLSFLCDLTLCQNPPLPPLWNGVLYRHQQTIDGKIASFFKGYEPFSEAFSFFTLQSTVQDFLHSFSDPKTNKRPRPLYLQGPGGIGKTYFAECLGNWIEELGLGHFKLRKLVITTPEQLEGSQETPGLFLNILVWASGIKAVSCF